MDRTGAAVTKRCPLCFSEVVRDGDTYGRCTRCRARVYLAPELGLSQETKDELIARLLSEAKAFRESTMEVSPESNEDE